MQTVGFVAYGEDSLSLIHILGVKTLLQAAATPYMDKLARMGRVGRLVTVAEGFHPGSEVANMSVLGYHLPKVYEGRGPLEAASIGVDLQDVYKRQLLQCRGYTCQDECCPD